MKIFIAVMVLLVIVAAAIICYALKDSMFRIDRMSGANFERYVEKLYIRLGYKAQRTKTSGDQGIDVIVKKAFRRIGLQVKRYNGAVGNGAVQEAVAGKKYYKLDKVCVITNSYFTAAAKELAKANKVTLVDRDGLKELIDKAKRK